MKGAGGLQIDPPPTEKKLLSKSPALKGLKQRLQELSFKK